MRDFELYLEKHRRLPFEWGHLDCFMFALRWADQSLCRQFRYHDVKTAVRLMRAMNVNYAWEAFDWYFKRRETPVNGNIVCVDGDDTTGLGGCGIWHNGLVYTVFEDAGVAACNPNLKHCWEV